MNTFFEILERLLLFAAVLLLIGFAVFTIFNTAVDASEKIKINVAELNKERTEHIFGFGNIWIPAETGQLILTAHE